MIISNNYRSEFVKKHSVDIAVAFTFFLLILVAALSLIESIKSNNNNIFADKALVGFFIINYFIAGVVIPLLFVCRGNSVKGFVSSFQLTFKWAIDAFRIKDAALYKAEKEANLERHDFWIIIRNLIFMFSYSLPCIIYVSSSGFFDSMITAVAICVCFLVTADNTMRAKEIYAIIDNDLNIQMAELSASENLSSGTPFVSMEDTMRNRIKRQLKHFELNREAYSASLTQEQKLFLRNLPNDDELGIPPPGYYAELKRHGIPDFPLSEEDKADIAKFGEAAERVAASRIAASKARQ